MMIRELREREREREREKKCTNKNLNTHVRIIMLWVNVIVRWWWAKISYMREIHVVHIDG